LAKEFVSKVEELVRDVKEIEDRSSAGFGPLKDFFTEESVAHPAKMNLWLLNYLIREYTRKGDVISDPMAGSGSTGIVASFLGRHSVLVELEWKFVEWIKENVKCLEKHGGKKGEISVLKGDARKLTELLGVNADLIVTSPPYAESVKRGVRGSLASKKILNGEIKVGCVNIGEGYSENSENIGNLEHGDVNAKFLSCPRATWLKNLTKLPNRKAKTESPDVIITSPPYSESLSEKSGGMKGRKNAPKRFTVGSDGNPQLYSDDPDNLGNLKHGEIDAVVTSPPYSESLTKKRKGYTTVPGLAKSREMPQDTRDDNIANLDHGNINVVITSPPYADSKKGGEADEDKMAERWDKTAEERDWNSWGKTWKTEGRKRALKSLGSGYSESEENIGNLPLGEVNAVITSPPYSNILSGDKDGPGATSIKNPRGFKPSSQPGYTQEKTWTEKHKINAVITSPPYEGSLEGTTRHTRGGIASRDPALTRTGTYATVMSFGVPVAYSPNKDNIGNLKSDEEEYEELEKKVDTVITSPPYSGSVNAPNDPERRAKRMRKAGLNPKTIVGGKARCGQTDWQYGDSEEQIGSLPHGEINTVITSPPYSDSYKGSSKTRDEQAENKLSRKVLMENPKGGGSLSLYTSPKNIAAKGFLEGMPKSEGNIGNLRHGEINVIVTSPPYPEANRGGGIAKEGYEGKYGKDSNLHLRHDRPLSDNPNNISNKPYREVEAAASKESYLSAMIRVYSECYKVLKRGGKVIIIIKPFIRNKRVVDLPLHTWLLLQKCGFKLVDVLKFRLPSQSFWRVLQYTKCDHSKMVNVADGKIVHRKKKVWVDDEGKEHDKKDVKKKTKCELFGECKPKLEGKKQSECASFVNSLERISHEYVLVCQK
jgi:DNA modification methylase